MQPILVPNIAGIFQGLLPSRQLAGTIARFAYPDAEGAAAAGH